MTLCYILIIIRRNKVSVYFFYAKRHILFPFFFCSASQELQNQSVGDGRLELPTSPSRTARATTCANPRWKLNSNLF